MTIDVSDGDDLCGTESDSTTEEVPALSAASNAHDTPTLVPPPPDEDAEPPTVRWTPPPVLLARSRFDSHGRTVASAINRTSRRRLYP